MENKMENKNKKQFVVLSRDFGYNKFYVVKIKAKTEEEAWEIVENEIATTNSQDWLLDKESLKDLKEQIKNL